MSLCSEFVTVNVSSCPASIFPLQSGENSDVTITPIGGAGEFSVTTYRPDSSGMRVPISEPGKF